MRNVLQEVLAANQRYAADFGDKAGLAMPPTRHFTILTCMDARLDPAKFAGLAEGDAHVIRNAGGRASDDAIRSLVISYKLLGTREWFVIHHTNCGMEFFTNDVMRGLLASSPGGVNCGGTGPTPVNCPAVSFAVGSTVVFTASPTNGSTFAGWGGDCSTSGSATTCSLVVDGPKSIIAAFD